MEGLKAMSKLAGQETEKAKTSVRHARHKALDAVKKAFKSTDERARAEKEVRGLVATNSECASGAAAGVPSQPLCSSLPFLYVASAEASAPLLVSTGWLVCSTFLFAVPPPPTLRCRDWWSSTPTPWKR